MVFEGKPRRPYENKNETWQVKEGLEGYINNGSLLSCIKDSMNIEEDIVDPNGPIKYKDYYEKNKHRFNATRVEERLKK